MPFVERAGALLHYEVSGTLDGPPVLLIMGLGFSSRAWDQLPQKLGVHHRVITFDNRGTGQSRVTRPLAIAGIDMPMLADDAAAVLEAAGVQSPVRVFGMSMGGMIAQELALRHGHRVCALALGATFASFLRGERPSISTMAKVLASLDRRRGRELTLGLLVSDTFRASSPERVDAWLETVEHAPVSVTLAQMLAISRHHALSRLQALKVPTLIISGDQDELVPVSNARHLQGAIAGARLVLLEGARHGFPLEREDDTVRVLLDFFVQGATMPTRDSG